jgi:two-component system sensor histidine kinase CpxA
MNELIEKNNAAVQRDPVDIVALAQSAAEDADYEAGRQNKSVTLKVDGTAEVTGNAGLLASAVENVVRNAIRHTAPSTAVEILVTCRSKTVVISVRDHGPGVPDSELEKIFAPFHRVGSARSRESGGTGLGLAIAQRAVALHEGTIVARNDDGGGLVVEVTLPRS